MAHNERLARFDFRHHKASASQRGITFQFTYEEWVAWWIKHQGPHWQERRGKHKGQYCMARNKDEGPYAPWNVECCLATENTGRANRGQESFKATISNREAVEIFLSPLSNRKLALLYGTSKGVINQIKTKQTWKYFTSKLVAPKRTKGRPILTEQDVVDVYSSTLPPKELSLKYKVSYQCIVDIINKRRWGHITAQLLRPRCAHRVNHAR